MSIRIRVSYEHENELREVLDRLEPIGIKIKREPEAGRYKRAYIVVKPSPDTPNKRLTNRPECGTISPAK